MKLSNHQPQDGAAHIYCLGCRLETVHASTQAGRLIYRCTNCSYVGPRALVIDPAIKWWIDAEHEYWHETSGIFVRGEGQKFLFFERMTYPFGLTIPAGHVDQGEKPAKTAQRELGEETGIKLPGQNFEFIATDDIQGDQCRRGADTHRWHSFACVKPPSAIVKVNPREGSRPVWLGLGQALSLNLTLATRYVITCHARQILLATQ
jgi:8-oxo-dGTP pyrophosphatase MutT (NUDIX family)